MSMIDLASLKQRNPLGQIVETFGVLLRGQGRVRQGVCPFHEESEGSFTVYGDTERWYCFGCGEGGDVLDFVRRVESLSLPQAIRRLDSGAGASGPSAAVAHPYTASPRRSAAPCSPPDPAVLAAAVRYYAGRLRRDAGAQAYLRSRGISPSAASCLGLGYAPEGGLSAALTAQGFSPERLRRSGLFAGERERFAGMIVVPDVDAGGRARWLVGRAVDPERTPRFQALPGPKPVLGLGRLGAAPPWVVLTEGVFDWLTLAQRGIPSCAALGTQGSERIAGALRGCRRVFLAFDADDAGRAATERLSALLGRRAAVITLPCGSADVAELASSPHGAATFLRLLRQAARAAA